MYFVYLCKTKSLNTTQLGFGNYNFRIHTNKAFLKLKGKLLPLRNEQMPLLILTKQKKTEKLADHTKQ